MYANQSSNPRVADTTTTTETTSTANPSSMWAAESWDLTPTTSATGSPGDTLAGPHARPVVVVLGLFTITGSTVSAVMLEGGEYVWLDLISRNGSRATPLAVVSDLDADHPHAQVEASHQHWADCPEIRWHLAHQTAQLYRAYLADRSPHASARQPRPRLGSVSPSCPEPRPRPHPANGNRSATGDAAETGREG